MVSSSVTATVPVQSRIASRGSDFFKRWACIFCNATVHTSTIHLKRHDVKGKCRKIFVALYFSHGVRKVGFCRTLRRRRHNFQNRGKCPINWGNPAYLGRVCVCRVSPLVFLVRIAPDRRGPGAWSGGVCAGEFVQPGRYGGGNRRFALAFGASSLVAGNEKCFVAL